MGRVTGRTYTDTPNHEHDCSKCEFQFGIIFSEGTMVDNLKETRRIDVYKQCKEDEKYLIRWSSDGPDYNSGVDFRSLCAGYFSNMMGGTR